jgi:Family of unknown function (DUF5996)
MPYCDALWPELEYPNWRDTAATLHLWTQIIGKVRLALTPWVNHSWQVPLYVTACGLGTSPVPLDNEAFEIEFDFIEHQLRARTSRGARREVPLQPQSVAQFFECVSALLRDLNLLVRVNEVPSELADPIPFSMDQTHHSYDAAAAHAFWRILLQVDRVLKRFRSGFIGKVSPVHFFWGSFDLAVTRFSGRAAPLHPGGVPGLSDAIVREAYSHEVSSAGFWPGNDAFPQAAFYSYAYPEGPGYRARAVTSGAYFEPRLGEFVLPYNAVRNAPNPEALLLDFLSSTYAAAADTGRWDRGQLECPIGIPGRVRALQSRIADEKERQHGSGEQNIVAAIQRRLAQQGVKCIVSVGYQHHPSNSPESVFEVVANGRSVELRLGYQEIVDSREHLPAGTMAKINDLIVQISREA